MATKKVEIARKYLDISDIETETTGPVYVLNRTAGQFRGNVLFSVARTSGQGHDRVKVPKTAIPINLTEQVPRVQLLNSSDFRRAVKDGILKLVHPDYAKALLATDDAKVEVQRLRNEESAARVAIQSAGLNDQDRKITVDEEEDEEEEAAVQSKKIRSDAVSAKVKNVVAKAPEQSQLEIVAGIKAIGEFNNAELNYLNKHLGKQFPRVKKVLQGYASERN